MVRKVSRTVVRLLVWTIAVVVIVSGALVWRLSSGPISLAWLNPYIERALTSRDDGGTVTIGATQLRWAEEGFDLQLVGQDVRGTSPDGETLYELSEIVIGVSLEALLAGVVAVSELEANAPLIVLTRNEEGRIGFSSAPTDDAEASRPSGHAMLPLEQMLDGYLSAVRVSSDHLVLDDRMAGQSFEARDAEFTILKRAGGLTARVEFELDQPEKAATVQLTGRMEAGTDLVNFDADLEDLQVAELAKLASSVPLEGVQLPISGRLTGTYHLGGEPGAIRFDLTAAEGSVAWADLLARPLPVTSLSLKGQVAADMAEVTVDQFNLKSNDARLEGSVKANWRDQVGLNATLRAANVTPADLEVFWPPAFGRAARQWVLDHITGGVVPEAQASLAFAPGELAQEPIPEAGVSGQFTFTDLTVDYLPSLTPLTQAHGTVNFTGRRMDFDVAGGGIGELVVKSGKVEITGIGIEGRDTTRLAVNAEVDGPLQTVLGLIDQPPLGLLSKNGVAPTAVSGHTRTKLQLGLPLHQDIEASELQITASSVLSDVGIQGLHPDFDIDAGQFQLNVDDQGVELAGDGQINQVPLDLEWRENFAADAPFARSYRVRGDLGQADLERLKVQLPLTIEGTGRFDASLQESKGVRHLDLGVDLESTAFALPELDWQKAEGEAGRLDATLTIPEDGPVDVATFELSGPSLAATGNGQFHIDPFQLERAELSRLQIGGNDTAITVERNADGRYDVAINAQSLDLDPLLAPETEATDQADAADEEASEPLPLALKVNAARVTMHGRELSDVTVDLVRDRAGWQSGSATARMPRGENVVLTLAADGAARRLQVTTVDAGDLFDVLDQIERIEGGEFDLVMNITQQHPQLAAEGELRMNDFTMLDAPSLAKLLTVASLTGIGNLLGGEGIHFDRFEMPFTFDEDVLTVTKGRLSGSQVGLTFKGDFDVERDRLDMKGTLVPVYTLNRAIGKIPLIGRFLTGADGEGAFAATYSVTGPAEDPRVFVNPLSMLAPGVIRELFSGILEGTTEAPVMRDSDK